MWGLPGDHFLSWHVMTKDFFLNPPKFTHRAMLIILCIKLQVAMISVILLFRNKSNYWLFPLCLLAGWVLKPVIPYFSWTQNIHCKLKVEPQSEANIMWNLPEIMFELALLCFTAGNWNSQGKSFVSPNTTQTVCKAIGNL